MKYTVITKNGSKWLRPTAPHGVDPIQWHSDNLDLPYIGSRPEGTTLDESEVREVRQWRNKNSSSLTWWDVSDGDVAFWTGVNAMDYLETRIAYTDAEPTDIDYEKEIPHKKWPSTKYVARPADAESHGLSEFDEILNNTSDDAKMNVSLQMDLNYWKRRCEAAERYINESPCDPDITNTQEAAYDAWQEIVKQQPK